MTLTLAATVPERDVEISLEVAEGETLSLVGPNGAGKSTVLALISGMLRPHAGYVTLDGRVLTETTAGSTRTWVPAHARQVATLTQDPVLFPHLTALGNIMFGLRAQGVPSRAARSQAHGWLEEIGLPELAARRPGQLSGGQAQRIAVARALAARPRLLLLDEPMAALDIDVTPALREQLVRFLRDRTAVIVTHEVLDAMTLSDRVAVVEDGRIAEHGPTMDVLARPRSSFAARFAGLNLVTGTWQDSRCTLSDGEQLSGRVSDEPRAPLVERTEHALADGARVHAAFRPSAVAIVDPAAVPVGMCVLRRTVTTLEPLGDLVRVRAEGIAADVTAQQVAELRLAPGTVVHLGIARHEVSIYPAQPM